VARQDPVRARRAGAEAMNQERRAVKCLRCGADSSWIKNAASALITDEEVATAREDERKAIVEWLMNLVPDEYSPSLLAARIERGDHEEKQK